MFIHAAMEGLMPQEISWRSRAFGDGENYFKGDLGHHAWKTCSNRTIAMSFHPLKMANICGKMRMREWDNLVTDDSLVISKPQVAFLCKTCKALT